MSPPAARTLSVIDYHTEGEPMRKAQCHCRECQYITGIDMFVGQASIQFKHFTGQDAPVDLMRKVIKQAISPVKVQ